MRVYLTCLFFILSIFKNLRILMRFILISLSILMILLILILISNRPSIGRTFKFAGTLRRWSHMARGAWRNSIQDQLTLRFLGWESHDWTHEMYVVLRCSNMILTVLCNCLGMECPEMSQVQLHSNRLEYIWFCLQFTGSHSNDPLSFYCIILV